MPFKYSLDGPHAIVLDADATARFMAGDRVEIETVAQARANGTGHVCAVIASNATDILYQVAPEVPTEPPTTPTLFGAVAKFVKQNFNDPDDE